MTFTRSIDGAEVAVILHSKLNLSEVGTKVLDLGFGPGNCVAQFLTDGYEVEAIDKIQKYCQNLLKSLNADSISTDKLVVHNLEIENFKFSDSTYSAIICQNVLHFLDKGISLKLLDRMIDSLLIGGFLWVAVHHYEHPLNGIKQNDFKSFYTEVELEEVFAKKTTLCYKEKATHKVLDNSVGVSYLLRRDKQ